MKEPARPARRRSDIAMAVHDHECITGFERATASRRRVRDRDVERSLGNRIDMESLGGAVDGHGDLPFLGLCFSGTVLFWAVGFRLIVAKAGIASAESEDLGHRYDGAS